MSRAMMALTPRRRNVLCLRAAGYSQVQIAAALGISHGQVRKDHVAINKLLIPGITNGTPGSNMGYRLTYVLGLLDAGVEPVDIPDYLNALVDRVKMRVAQTDRETAMLATITD